MILDVVKAGLPIDHIPIVDIHGHLGPWQLVHMPAVSTEQMVETMDRVGIDRLCLNASMGCFSGDFRGGNDLVGEAVHKHPDRLVGQTIVNPNYPDQIVPELDRCRQRYGMRLAKIHPFCHEHPVDGPGYREFWDYADQHSLLVLAHSWEADRTCSPELYGKIAAEHKRVRIIMAHAGGTQKGCDDAMRTARQYENLFIDTATSQVHFGMIERYVAHLGAERVLCGSDIPRIHPAVPLGRIAYAKIAERDKEKILGRNAMALLGL